jgi:probable rRNA maturation factor
LTLRAAMTAFEIEFSGDKIPPRGAKAILRRAIKASLRAHNISAAKFGIRFVSDAEMSQLNWKHLQHEGSTDVLTFDLRDDSERGDIDAELVICVDAAHRGAENFGHSVQAELALYAVHGTLHLLGYSDKSAKSAKSMHQMEDRLLDSVGLGAVYAPMPR